MKHPYLLLVSGPAGAGKSELAELWASSQEFPCARVTPDDTWDLIKSGHVDPVFEWNDEARRQHEITLDGVAALIHNFLQNDISVVVDDVVFPAWPESGPEAWKRRLPGIELNLLVLMPSWDVIVRRNAERSGRDNLPETMLRTIYDDMQGRREQSEVPLIDNGEMTPEETISQVRTSLA